MSYNINIIIDSLKPFNDDNILTLPQRTQKSLKEVSPQKILLQQNKPLILFFEVSDSLSTEDIFKKYWNFSEAPIIFVEKDGEIEIYNGFDYIIENNQPKPKKIKDKDGLNYYSLMSGKYFLKSKEFKNSNNRINKVLLENIKWARSQILSKLDTTSKEEIVNALIGRVIFIRYLIDRKIELTYKDKKQKVTKNTFIEILKNKDDTYSFFRDLQSPDKGFNGDWFPINKEEDNLINDTHLNILVELLKGTDLKNSQKSLFDFYDFSIIPIEFISNVYEHFIGEEKQKKDGAFYTPTFLVDYVLKYTIDKYFEENSSTYNCKVIDPACGSGIFLVETFRKLVAQYEKIKGKKPDEEALKKLVTDNIFGIDINKSAIDISVFSLYLAMLDYQEPKDIKNFKFPYLTKGDNANFFHNDFFDTEAKFNRLKNIQFIIGNPPYGRGLVKKSSFAQKYVKDENLTISNEEIVQPFMARVKDFKDVKVSFIITSKVFYNLQAKEFRKSFLEEFEIEHILELSSVRKEIFGSATTPVSIIFYKYNPQNAQDNVIKYISMKPSPYFEKTKFLLLTKQDFKKVLQSKLIEHDYLWKILVYGSYLDFNFIKRLKKLKTIAESIDTQAQGITVGGKDKNSTKEYDGMSFVETSDIENFYIKNSNKIWKEKDVHRNKSIELFKAPSLLVSKGLNKKTLQLKVGLLNKNAVFTDSITTLKSDKLDTLYIIEGLLYSSVFKYYIMETASSIGIEREQLHNPEKFSIPYVESKKIIEVVRRLENLQKEHFDTNSSNTLNYNNEFKKLTKELDDVVLEAFNLTEQEKALIDYTTNIMIPWVIQKKYGVAFSQYEYKNKEIEEYVKIFIEHYSKMYEENNLFFQAKIYWSQYAIAVYFKALKEKQKNQIEWIEEENIENFLELMHGKTLENLFIQKDIKGFEKDGFYVVKPNEIKNWHKAIGYLDFYEFKDAILRAGKEKWKN